jgi:hypothetical protein
MFCSLVLFVINTMENWSLVSLSHVTINKDTDVKIRTIYSIEYRGKNLVPKY